ncbi:hypothetical protein GCM10018963_55810 [Saccharothrix longispora]
MNSWAIEPALVVTASKSTVAGGAPDPATASATRVPSAAPAQYPQHRADPAAGRRHLRRPALDARVQRTGARPREVQEAGAHRDTGREVREARRGPGAREVQAQHDIRSPVDQYPPVGQLHRPTSPVSTAAVSAR